MEYLLLQENVNLADAAFLNLFAALPLQPDQLIPVALRHVDPIQLIVY